MVQRVIKAVKLRTFLISTCLQVLNQVNFWQQEDKRPLSLSTNIFKSGTLTMGVNCIKTGKVCQKFNETDKL